MAKNSGAQDRYELIFKNGALDKLRQLAAQFDIPESELSQVVEKGLKALELPADDGKLMFKKGGETYFIDIKEL